MTFTDSRGCFFIVTADEYVICHGSGFLEFQRQRIVYNNDLFFIVRRFLQVFRKDDLVCWRSAYKWMKIKLLSRFSNFLDVKSLQNWVRRKQREKMKTISETWLCVMLKKKNCWSWVHSHWYYSKLEVALGQLRDEWGTSYEIYTVRALLPWSQINSNV